MKHPLRTLFLVALAGGLAYGGYRLAAPRLFGVPVKTVAVTRGNIIETVVASGRAETPSGVDVASQVIGTVARVYVDEGSRVRAGDPLVSLDDRQAAAGVEQAQAALRQAEVKRRQLVDLTLPVARQTLIQMEANRTNARAQLDRALTLADRSVASGASVEALQRAFDVADAQWRAAELAVASASPGGGESALAEAALAESTAKLRVAEAQLALTRINTPIDGLVTSRDVEEGVIAQPGKVLLHVAPLKPKQLVVQVDERNLARIRPGQKAVASADARPDVTFDAVLASIDSTIDADRGSVEVKFDLAKEPEFLKENMTVSVDVEVARREATLLLPLDAVRDAAGPKPSVLVAEDGLATERAVTLGARDTDMVEILSGLKEGEAVIPAAASVEPGAKVRANAGGT